MKRNNIKKWFVIVLVTLIAFVAAAYSSQHHQDTVKSPSINKTGIVLQDDIEASWFIWHDELHYVFTDRTMRSLDKNMKIMRFSDGAMVSIFGDGYGCQDAIVVDDTLHIFATNCYMDYEHKQNSIVHLSTKDLVTWTQPEVVYTPEPNAQLYNVGVSYGDGQYVIGYDVQNQDIADTFVTRFIASNDLTNWQPVGDLWQAHGCVDMHFVDGAWHIFGYEDIPGGGWRTVVAKTYDFIDFQNTGQLLNPELPFEDVNTTDPDLIEFNGKTYIFYMVGDQHTYARLTYAVFDGSIDELVDYVSAK